MCKYRFIRQFYWLLLVILCLMLGGCVFDAKLSTDAMQMNEAEAKAKPNVWDIRDAKITFDLKTYIDAYYKGRPVVVDFWNTWCMPCLKAHGQTEELRKGPDGEGVVFLYISDSSSKDDTEFDKISMEVGGEHLRLGQDVAFTYLEREGFNSFPAYFFFDRNHNLVHKQTAFPGKEKYQELLRKINQK